MSDVAGDKTANPSESEKRERSSIEFPYMSLDEAMEVARAIHTTTGSGQCEADQLAAALKLSMASSGFRVRISTAKMFGLIESERGSGAMRLTDLGHRIVDPSQERAAKVQAFQTVPLYAKLVEIHRGKTLPPPAALERVMAELGVAKKQTDRARQTFDRSASLAGFFEFGRDKLVTPAIGSQVGDKPREADPPKEPTKVPAGEPGIGGASLTGDPLVDALVQKLPKAGAQWPDAERKTWLKMVEMAFDLAYGVTSPSVTTSSS